MQNSLYSIERKAFTYLSDVSGCILIESNLFHINIGYGSKYLRYNYTHIYLFIIIYLVAYHLVSLRVTFHGLFKSIKKNNF